MRISSAFLCGAVVKRLGALALVVSCFVLGSSTCLGENIVSPAESRAILAERIKRIKREVRVLDDKLRTRGLAEQDFRLMQDLRTTLEQERKILEEEVETYRAIEGNPVLMHLVAGSTVTASTATTKSLWESGGWARFEGILPCAGCQGVETSLTLYNDGLKYSLEERTLGPGSPDRTFTSEGVWTTLRGHKDDPDATVFELDYDKPGRERRFLRITDDEIRLLDLDETKLKKKHNLLLERVAP